MDVLENVLLEPEDAETNARIRDAAHDLLHALQVQEAAEDAHCNCPECDEGDREWWTCGPCSERYGHAIDLRRAVLVKVGAMRVVSLPDAGGADLQKAAAKEST